MMHVIVNYILKFSGCFNDGSSESTTCLWCPILVYYTKRLEGDDRDKLGNLYSYAFVVCHLLEPLERNRESPEYSSK